MNDKRTDISKILNMTVLNNMTYIRKLQALGVQNMKTKYSIFGEEAMVLSQLTKSHSYYPPRWANTYSEAVANVIDFIRLEKNDPSFGKSIERMANLSTYSNGTLMG